MKSSTKQYALFKRDNDGKLWAMYDQSTCSMGWSSNMANLWDSPPLHYFDPAEGHFIIKVTRKYPDIEFTGKVMRGRERNKHWIRKTND